MRSVASNEAHAPRRYSPQKETRHVGSWIGKLVKVTLSSKPDTVQEPFHYAKIRSPFRVENPRITELVPSRLPSSF